MSGAERTRRWRERHAANRMAVYGDVPTVTVEALIAAGELTEKDSCRPRCVVAALNRVAAKAIKNVTPSLKTASVDGRI
jgi:hypothetical protein